jgi:hypothetical protein
VCIPPPGWRFPLTFGAPGRSIGLVCARSSHLVTMPQFAELHDHPMGEEVASSAPLASRRPPSRVVAPVMPQRAAGQPSRAVSQPAQNGPLTAAKELLHNPPDVAALPDVLRQWRDDVDCLLNLAQVTPGSAGGSVSRQRRRQGGASGSVHSPSTRSARIEDLRAELNRRCAGEDARISIERACVRRLNIEGRNLEAELDAAVPKLQGLAQAPVAGVGCAALVDHFRAVAWPSKFRPHLPEKYDGSTNPSEFLQVYITAITAAGGNDAVMATYFHVALTGPARTWLMNLTPGSIQSWGELCAQFTWKLCQRAPAAWRGGPPPRREATTRGNPPGLHLLLYQGTWNNSTHFRCIYYHGFSSGGP